MSEIESLALLDPVNGTTDQKYKQKYCSRINCKYYNQNRLPPQEVVKLLQLSHCGLILSEHEGACRASCEYLSAGLPVVSTPSVGGRDVWFDDYNSMIVKPDPKEIKEAVEYFKNHPRNPNVIRRNFLKKAQIFQNRFKNQ
ncbi:MAG: glycosyltransferase, partial [bacterium]